MALTLQRKNGPVPDERITQTEQTLGVHFPAGYRSFLASTGGGSTGANLVIPGTERNGLLDRLYGIDRLPRAQERIGFNEIVPERYLLVGDGAGGALAVDSGDGSVWWADWDKGEELGVTGPSQDVMLRLADDFNAFLALFD